MNYNKSTHKFTTEKVYPEDYVTWTKGSLYFQNESLDNIMKALSRVYDVTIHIDSPRIAEERFTGTIPGWWYTECFEYYNVNLSVPLRSKGLCHCIKREISPSLLM